MFTPSSQFFKRYQVACVFGDCGGSWCVVSLLDHLQEQHVRPKDDYWYLFNLTFVFLTVGGCRVIVACM